MTKVTFTPRKNKLDDDAAMNGVNFKATDRWGDDMGTYTLRYIDLESPRGKANFDRFKAKYRAQIQGNMLTEIQQDGIFLAENVVIDWDIPSELTNGKKVAFDVDTARDWFMQDATSDFVRAMLLFAADCRNYALIEDVNGVATDEKN